MADKGEGVDKNDLYGLFIESYRKMQDFTDTAARKASDLPYSSGGTNIRTENNYYGKKEGDNDGAKKLRKLLIAGVLAATGIGGMGVGGFAAYSAIGGVLSDLIGKSKQSEVQSGHDDVDTGFEFLLLPREIDGP